MTHGINAKWSIAMPVIVTSASSYISLNEMVMRDGLGTT
jgi:hypothetical protein